MEGQEVARVTYLLIEPSTSYPLMPSLQASYFCISAGSVERSAAPGKVRRNALDIIPVLVIGDLAVNRDHAGKGWARTCCQTLCAQIAQASKSISIRAVLVQTKDEAAKRFYLRCAEFLNIRMIAEHCF